MSDHIDLVKETVTAQLAADETAMTAAEAEDYLLHLDEWELTTEDGVGCEITRTFEMQDEAQAIEYVNRLNAIASEQHHIPDIRVLGEHVEVTCYTEGIEGLHRNDFIMAAHADDLYARWDVITGERDEVTQASDESFPASDPPAY